MALEERIISYRILDTMSPVVWFDNWNKIFKNPFYNIRTGTYTSAAYTAIALMYDAAPIDMQLTTYNFVLSCSRRILDNERVLAISRTFQQFNNYARSQFRVGAISCHPDFLDEISSPAHEFAEDEAFIDSPNGLANMRTFGMLDTNVGTNTGFVQTLYELAQLAPTDKYTVFL